jgi:hypothetical protein
MRGGSKAVVGVRRVVVHGVSVRVRAMVSRRWRMMVHLLVQERVVNGLQVIHFFVFETKISIAWCFFADFKKKDVISEYQKKTNI